MDVEAAALSGIPTCKGTPHFFVEHVFPHPIFKTYPLNLQRVGLFKLPHTLIRKRGSGRFEVFRNPAYESV